MPDSRSFRRRASRRSVLLAGALAPLIARPAAAEALFCPACGTGRRRPLAPVRSIHVPMRDGVRIALDIVLPVDLKPGERLPVLLSMTRYWRGERGSGPSDIAAFYGPKGYAVVVGDVRGTGASFGRWTHHRSRAETRDFSEIVDWAAAQPWSDGRVIATGNSYAANTADWTAAQGRASVVGIVPRFPDYDPYADLYFPGGVPNAYMGRTWGQSVKALDLGRLPPSAGPPGPGIRPVDADADGALLRAAIAARADVPSVWEGLHTVVFRDDRPATWQGESMDDWGIHSHAAALEAAGTPMQTWAGWMDSGVAAGAIHRFTTLTNAQRVYIGAWSHGGVHDASPYQPDDAPPNPGFEVQERTDLGFMDACARGHAPKRGDRRLFYFTLGEERWKSTAVWPPPGSRLEAWSLCEGGRLVRAPAGDEGADRYAVDFTASTGKANRWATNAGGADVIYGDRAEADRKCLCYTSAPLERDLEITGTPVAELKLASTHADGAVFVYLEDVGPDGRVRYLTEGQLRVIHRKVSTERPPYRIDGPYHTFRRADAWPLTPGEIADLDFVLMPISVRLGAGHRLRIALAGADADTFARLPAEGDPILTIHRGPGRPSRILLPIVG